MEVAVDRAELLLKVGHDQEDNGQVDEESTNDYQVVQVRTRQANHSTVGKINYYNYFHINDRDLLTFCF